MDIYEFVRVCEERGLSSDEAFRELGRALEDRARAWEETYYNDPWNRDVWAQEDLIDSYRRER